MSERTKTENELKKEFLSSYQRAKEKIKRLEEHLHELRLNKISPSVINDGMPHSTNTSDLSDYAAKLDEIEREITRARYEQICAFQNVERAIEAIEDEHEKDLLTYRYIKAMKWEGVAVKMDYSWKQTHRIHGRALTNLKMT